MTKDNWRKLDILARLIVAGFMIPAGIFAMTEGELLVGVIAITVALPYAMQLVKDVRKSSND